MIDDLTDAAWNPELNDLFLRIEHRFGRADPLAQVMSGGALHVADQPHQQGVQIGGSREDPVDCLGGVQPLLAAEGAGSDQRTVAQQVGT
ncbi:hypothetical protein [Streptomyces sp. NPDC055134]